MIANVGRCAGRGAGAALDWLYASLAGLMPIKTRGGRQRAAALEALDDEDDVDAHVGVRERAESAPHCWDASDTGLAPPRSSLWRDCCVEALAQAGTASA